MFKTLGIVQAPFSSPAFRIHSARRIDGKPMLEWVVRRVTESMRLDGVIVVADGAEGHAMNHQLVPADIPVFDRPAPDMLARFALAMEEFPAEAVVHIRGDSLFIDPGLIDRLIVAAESEGETAGKAVSECDYASYGGRDGRPAMLSPVGIYAEWFRTKALQRAHRAAVDRQDRVQIGRYIYSHNDKFKIRWIPAPDEIDRDDVRLTVANGDDWDHVLDIIDAIGAESLDWQGIARFLDHQPAMRKRMADLNHAST